MFTICPYSIHVGIIWFVDALSLGLQSRRTRTADKEIRTKLVKQKFGFKHHEIGSIILVLMIVWALLRRWSDLSLQNVMH